jgi:hypothetical protein
MDNIFETFKSQGYNEEDIRDTLLEEASGVIQTFASDGYDSEDILSVISDATGIPMAMYEDAPTDTEATTSKEESTIQDREISLLQKEKDSRISNLDLSQITDDEERVNLAKEKIALEYDKRIETLDKEQETDRIKQQKIAMDREKKVALYNKRKKEKELPEEAEVVADMA